MYCRHTLQEVYVHLWCSTLPSTQYARTHTHTLDNLMVSSDIEMSYFKGFSSERSRLWYLKQPPRVLSTHTHIHTYSYTHSLALQQKYTDWSQCRAIERKSKKLQGRERERAFPLLRIYLMVHLLLLHFFPRYFLSCLCCLHIVTLVLLVQAPSNKLYGLTSAEHHTEPSWYRLYK